MNNAIMTIVKKELSRFFGDRRTAFTTILLPGIIIFVLYSVMGNALSSQFSVEEDYIPSCYIQYLPPDKTLQEMLMSGFAVKEISSEDEFEQAKEKITDSELDLCVVFPENFVGDIRAQMRASDGEDIVIPEVQVFYNSSATESLSGYMIMLDMLDEYESMLSNCFDVNRSEDEESFDLANEDEDPMTSIFASMLPMLLMMFLFSGVVAVAPESIAGEKERGTIATLLVTPVKRSNIAIGKILALSFIALLSGASSTIGTILSMPKLMGAAADELGGVSYALTDYLLLALVIFTTVLVLSTAVSLISAFSKSIKEAQTYVSPLMIVAVLVGITAMFGGGASDNPLHYIIPLYNSVQSMVQIFNFGAVPHLIILTLCSNAVYALLGAFGLTMMFKSERIIFSK